MGSIDQFQRTVQKASVNGESFTTVSSGMSRTIQLPNGLKLKYFGQREKKSMISGAFLVPMVQREIDKYIEQNGIPAHQIIQDVQLFNLPLIQQNLGSNKPAVGVDINACYWNTAYQLGYISEKLYTRGLSAAKKEGLLISIGCLNKKPIIRHYVGGELVSVTYDKEHHQRYSPFYWNVIQRTHQIMMDSYEAFKDNWYMFLTDCLFVDAHKAKDAQKFIKKLGYESKPHAIDYRAFDGKKLYWFDHKDAKDKVIHADGRDIRVAFALHNIAKGML